MKNWVIAEGTNPGLLGAYHWFLILLFAGLCFLAYRYRHASDKTSRRILLCAGLWMLLWEAIKQAVLLNRDVAYNWHDFPLQPCSIAMYIVIAAALMPDGRIRRYLTAFLATFGFVFGMTVVVVPVFVFAEYQEVLLLWQSPQHHVILAAIGVYLCMTGTVPLEFSTFVKGAKTYLIIFASCFVLDLIVQPFLPAGAFMNAFYAGPFHLYEMPIVSMFAEFPTYKTWAPAYLFFNMLLGFVAYWVLYASFKASTKVHRHFLPLGS